MGVPSSVSNEDEKLLLIISTLRKKNEELLHDNEKLRNINKRPVHNENDRLLSSPLSYELSRRKLKRDITEMWFSIQSELPNLLDQSKSESLINLLEGHHYNILLDLLNLTENDGFQFARQSESRALGELIQRRLRYLQNPADCDNARKLVCKLNKACGFGCQIHHAVYCFIVAYGTQRTLILLSHGWQYDTAGFENVYMPLSETCNSTIAVIKSYKMWPGTPSDKVVRLPIVDGIYPKPLFLPPALPADLADRIIKLHGNPIVWWISQFLKYMLRPNHALAKKLTESEVAHEIMMSPVVGIHIRRTDKLGTEAAFHSVDEYMKHVQKYFDFFEFKEGVKIIRRVFVASDDPKILSQCRHKYPEYTFTGSETKTASFGKRYSKASLLGIITDIHLLSKTDYLVCTFSSQVCRLAYEIMQQNHVDAADRFKSLDDVWYYGGQEEHQLEAVVSHKKTDPSQIDMEVGDIIGLAGNHWNGYSKGRNHRSQKIGLFPGYKVKELFNIVKEFPAYPQVL